MVTVHALEEHAPMVTAFSLISCDWIGASSQSPPWYERAQGTAQAELSSAAAICILCRIDSSHAPAFVSDCTPTARVGGGLGGGGEKGGGGVDGGS